MIILWQEFDIKVYFNSQIVIIQQYNALSLHTIFRYSLYK